MKTKTTGKNKILSTRVFNHENLTALTDALNTLPTGFGTPYLINCGSQRRTLITIEKVRQQLIGHAAFRFGKLVKNGQNKFEGIVVHRVR